MIVNYRSESRDWGFVINEIKDGLKFENKDEALKILLFFKNKIHVTYESTSVPISLINVSGF